MTDLPSTYFFEHLGPDIEWAQCEAAGFSLRIGNHAWVFGRYDYRDKSCPQWWPQITIVLGHKPYPHRSRHWKLRAFGRRIFDIGGRPR